MNERVIDLPEIRQKQYKWVSIGEVFLPPCQEDRLLDEVKVARIIAAFNDNAFGTPILSYREHGNRGPRGEAYALVSGQHRFEVARRIGRTRVYCEVVYGLTLIDEAQLWLDEDNRKRQSGLAKFHLERQASKGIALEIWSIANDNGFVIARNDGDKSSRSLRCISALEKTHQRGNLRETLHVLAAAFNHDTMGSSATVVNGLSIALKFRPQMDRKRLAAKLAHFGPAVLLTRYRGANESYGGDQRLTMANVMIGIFNHHLREDAVVPAITIAETRTVPTASRDESVEGGTKSGQIRRIKSTGKTLAEARAEVAARATVNA